MSFKCSTPFYSDGYKVGHKRMMADNTDFLYGTWIPRSLKYAPKGVKTVMSFGQKMTVRWLHDEWQENFFDKPISIIDSFARDMSSYLGMDYDASHFGELHKLGYLPIRIKSLPEGIETPTGVPHMTFVNTVSGFAWLTLYLETMISSLAWKPTTSATIAAMYMRNSIEWVRKTDIGNLWLVDYMNHDFSARGLSPWDMIASGMGHATSHRGSDTLVVIPASRYFYDVPSDEVVINSVNASEHSVSTTQIFTIGEKAMLSKWLKVFPKGILSAVSDTMDLTKVVKPVPGGYVYDLKEEILARDGKLVIRPDSNPSGLTPVDIICGHDMELSQRELDADYPEFYHKGLVECLWDIFGGSINEQGYKVLDPHIGGIYGDAITLERQVEIYDRLEKKGFASTNIVLGVGSFTYQHNTRDTLGWAAKGGWFEADGISYDIYKEPMTDDGTKTSPRGMLQVYVNESGVISLKENCTREEEEAGIMETIYEDGKVLSTTTFGQIRERIKSIM